MRTHTPPPSVISHPRRLPACHVQLPLKLLVSESARAADARQQSNKRRCASKRQRGGGEKESVRASSRAAKKSGDESHIFHPSPPICGSVSFSMLIQFLPCFAAAGAGGMAWTDNSGC